MRFAILSATLLALSAPAFAQTPDYETIDVTKLIDGQHHQSAIADLSRTGDVTGWVEMGDGESRAFLYSGGKTVILNPPGEKGSCTGRTFDGKGGVVVGCDDAYYLFAKGRWTTIKKVGQVNVREILRIRGGHTLLRGFVREGESNAHYVVAPDGTHRLLK